MRDTQEAIDRFYWRHGPCCAGCDHWRALGPIVGECLQSAPMPADQRLEMIGMRSCSLKVGAGHAFTPRDHRCGQFKDEFNWETLPLLYRKRIGANIQEQPHGN